MPGEVVVTEKPNVEVAELEYKERPVILVAISPHSAEKWRRDYAKGMAQFLIEEPEKRAVFEKYLYEHPSEKTKEMSMEWLKGIVSYIAEKPEWWWERKPGYVEEKLVKAIAEKVPA